MINMSYNPIEFIYENPVQSRLVALTALTGGVVYILYRIIRNNQEIAAAWGRTSDNWGKMAKGFEEMREDRNELERKLEENHQRDKELIKELKSRD